MFQPAFAIWSRVYQKFFLSVTSFFLASNCTPTCSYPQPPNTHTDTLPPVPLLTHRNDLATHSDGLVSGVAEVISINGDGLALPLICPSSVVPAVKHTQTEFRMLSVMPFISLWTLNILKDQCLILEKVTKSAEICFLR